MLIVKGGQASTDLGDKPRFCHFQRGCTSGAYNARADAETPQSADQGVQALGCCFFDDYLGHRSMVLENPALSSWDTSSSDRGLDLSPSAMSGKAYHGIPHQGAGAAAPAGRVRVRRRADRYSPSARRVPRQRSRPVTPLADRLAPFIASSLEPVTNCPTRLGAGEHGHKRGRSPVPPTCPHVRDCRRG